MIRPWVARSLRLRKVWVELFPSRLLVLTAIVSTFMVHRIKLVSTSKLCSSHGCDLIKVK